MNMTDTLRETLERMIELAEIAANIAAAKESGEIPPAQAQEARAALVTGE